METDINVSYDPDRGELTFQGGTTRHDGLESMEWFKSEVLRIENENGYSYEFCFNGHKHTWRDGRLVINGDYESMVMFEKEGDDDHYAYKVDFNGRKLKEYHTYPHHEYHEWFFM